MKRGRSKGGDGKGAGRRRKRRRARVEKSSGGVVFRNNGEGLEFLLIRDPYENWGLPKGHIESEESAEAAALREVAEETGLLELLVVTPLPTIDWYYRDRGRLIHKFCHFYLMQSGAGEAVPQLDEGITQCIWRSFDGAMQTVTYDNARQVLRAAGVHLGSCPAD